MFILFFCLGSFPAVYAQGFEGYSRYPDIYGDRIVFTAEGDLWTVSVSGGKIVYQRGADPAEYIALAKPGPKGDKVVLTSRGRVFVAPVRDGRYIDFTDKSGVRFRDAVFSHEGKSVYALSDESGEFEFVALAADGIGAEKAVTKDGEILRFEGHGFEPDIELDNVPQPPPFPVKSFENNKKIKGLPPRIV